MGSPLFTLPPKNQPFTTHWPTKINVPVHGGGLEEQILNTRFAVMEEGEIKKIQDSGLKVMSGGSEKTREMWENLGPSALFMSHAPSAVKLFEKAIVSIDGLKRQSKTPEADEEVDLEDVAYSKAVLKTFCEIPFMRQGLVTSYFKFLQGVETKN